MGKDPTSFIFLKKIVIIKLTDQNIRIKLFIEGAKGIVKAKRIRQK
jgi:hypothetical protein